MRVVLEILIPLLLPALVYWLYLQIQERRGVTVREVPLTWLGVAGVALLVISLSATWLAGSEPPTGKYIPPHVDENGVVVPGHFEETDAGQ